MAWSTSSRLSRLPPDWRSRIVPRILARDKHVCQIKGPGCQVQATEVDHKVAGDDHSEDNLQAACERCHAKKSSKEGNAAKAKLRALRRRPAERHPGTR